MYLEILETALSPTGFLYDNNSANLSSRVKFAIYFLEKIAYFTPELLNMKNDIRDTGGIT